MMRFDSPVRVLHFIHSLKSGGAEQQLLYLLTHSDPASLTHAVCCFNASTVEALPAEIEVFELERKSKYDLQYGKIKGLLDAWQPDIIHNWLPNVMINSFFPARKFRKAIYLASFRRADPLNSLFSALNAFLYLLSDALVSNVESASMNFPFKQIFDLKSGRHIPNGFPLEKIYRIEPRLDPVPGSRPEDVVLLFAGRLSPEKNVSLLLQALQRLSEANPGLRLIICGEGEQKIQLHQQVQDLALEGRVTFLGYQEDLISIMKSCDLLVLPSFREGMPNVLYEALAAGLPAIASNIPPHVSLFGRDKLIPLFDPTSVEDLSNSIQAMLDRSDREIEFHRETAKQFLEGMDIEHMVRNYLTYYRQIVGDR